jgi:membrane protease YdiL (CAAX protease family)
VFRPFLAHWFKTDLAVAVPLFCLLTAVRFVAEHVPPLWFPLLIAYIAVPLLTVPRSNWSRIGLKKPSALWPIGVAMAAATLVKTATIIVLFALLEDAPANWMLGIAETYRDMPTHPPAVIGIILFFMVGAPVAEEIFFRTLQAAWETRYSPWSATTATALLFGLAHIDQYLFPLSPLGMLVRFVPVSIYGLVHAWAYHKTGSTYASVVSHLAGNAAEASILILFVLPTM